MEMLDRRTEGASNEVIVFFTPHRPSRTNRYGWVVYYPCLQLRSTTSGIEVESILGWLILEYENPKAEQCGVRVYVRACILTYPLGARVGVVLV